MDGNILMIIRVVQETDPFTQKKNSGSNKKLDLLWLLIKRIFIYFNSSRKRF